jgi:hypothetical protein
MKDKSSQLEQIFDAIAQKCRLSITQDGQTKQIQGWLYFLNLENDELKSERKVTRLLYADKVAAVDIYDYEEKKSLCYSVHSPYLSGQVEFLKTIELDIAKCILEKITPEETKTKDVDMKHVFGIDINNFSEVEKFLYAHIDYY